MALIENLHEQRRPPRDLPVLNTGSKWAAPTELPSLKGVKRLGFDTETKDRDLENLGPGFRRSGDSKAYIVGMSLALDDDGPRMYIPVRHEGGGNLDERVVKRWAQSELQNFDGELVGGNLAYDMDAMAALQFGVTFPNVRKFRDVLVAEPILDEWRLSYSLDSVLKARIGKGKAYDHVHRVMKIYGYKSEKEFKQNLWRHPAHDIGEYAEGDVAELLSCLDAQLAQMDLEDRDEGVHLRKVFDLECDLIPILVAMRIRGVRVDYTRAYAIKRELEEECNRYLMILRRLAGPKAEFMAPESFAKALSDNGFDVPMTSATHRKDGVPLKKTRESKPSITKEWLKANAGDPIVDAVRGGRRVDYIINTFIKGHIFTHSIPESDRYGRIHPTFKQLKGGGDTDEGNDDGDDTSGTIARFACRDPNLQNIPARDPYLGPLIRSMFVPEEDEDWESNDASQIEYRYLVHFANGHGADEARRKYNEDHKTDFHIFGGDLLGVDIRNDEFVRKKIKNTGFCKVYGGGDRKLAATAECSLEEASRFSKIYDRKLPFVSETFKKASKWALKRGFVVTVLGRKQRFPLWELKKRQYDNEGNPIYMMPLPYDQAVNYWGPKRYEFEDEATFNKTMVRWLKNPTICRAWSYMALNRKLQGSGADHMKAWMVAGTKTGVDRVLGPMLITVHDEGNRSVPRTAEGREAAAEFVRCGETCIPNLRVPILIKSKRGPNWGACE